MGAKKQRKELVGFQLWCSVCVEKKSPVTRPSTHLVLHRENPYDMIPGQAVIDQRRVGVCEDCLEDKNPFQRYYAQEIELTQKEPVYKDE